MGHPTVRVDQEEPSRLSPPQVELTILHSQTGGLRLMDCVPSGRGEA